MRIWARDRRKAPRWKGVHRRLYIAAILSFCVAPANPPWKGSDGQREKSRLAIAACVPVENCYCFYDSGRRRRGGDDPDKDVMMIYIAPTTRDADVSLIYGQYDCRLSWWAARKKRTSLLDDLLIIIASFWLPFVTRNRGVSPLQKDSNPTHFVLAIRRIQPNAIDPTKFKWKMEIPSPTKRKKRKEKRWGVLFPIVGKEIDGNW